MAANIVRVGLGSLILIIVLMVVVKPIVKSLVDAPAAANLALAGPAGAGGLGGAEMAASEGAGGAQAGGGDMVMADGESMEQFRDRLKKSAAPKKSSISADMLDTANTYDDKVALIRMLVAEDSGRVANVLKSMIRSEGAA